MSPEKRMPTAGFSQPSKRGLTDAAVDVAAEWPADSTIGSGATLPSSAGGLLVQATYPSARQIAMTRTTARIVRFDIRCSSFTTVWILCSRQKHRQGDFR